MNTSSEEGRLERGYRRLLAVYPAAHRARYGEEMLGVLMTAARPGRRRPDPGEAVSLLLGGLRARLRVPHGGAASPRWWDATAVARYLATLLLATTYGHQVVAGWVWHRMWNDFGYGAPPASKGTILLAAGWIVVTVAARLGRYRLAAVLAAALTVVEPARLAVRYPNLPDALVTNWWLVVLAVTATGMLAWSARRAAPRHPALQRPAKQPDRHPHDRPTPAGADRPRRRPGWRAVTAGLALVTSATPVLEAAGTDVTGTWSTTFSVNERLRVLWFDPTRLAGLALVLTTAVVVWRLAPTVRRRVLVLAAPTVATVLLVWVMFGGFLQSSPRFDPPVLLVTPQWLALTLVPVLVFALGAAAVTRHERRLASGVLLT